MRMQGIAGLHKMSSRRLGRVTVAADSLREASTSPSENRRRRPRTEVNERGRKWQFNSFVRAKELENRRRLSYRQ